MKIASQHSAWAPRAAGRLLVLAVRMALCAVVWVVALLPVPVQAREKAPVREPLQDYLARVGQTASGTAAQRETGSLWKNDGLLADMATDYKAHHAGDLVQIVIVQDTDAQNSGSVGTDRSFKASSSINAIPGGFAPPQLQNLFSPVSAATLAGKAQASSTLKLRTTLMGRVVAVLPSGALVVEAQRATTMNNERQTVVLRGVARPGDIAGDGSVLSTSLSDLEVELKGKGVISDGTRPPNGIVRWVLRILNF
jgi:flagellar L-ring protein precursor FlgH